MTMPGKYEILEEIGRDSLAVVYRACDTRMGREVVLKVIHHAKQHVSSITWRSL
jgi:serine/threonine protein kinase